MARSTHLVVIAVVAFVVPALSPSSFAADKVSMSFVPSPGCVFCTFDSLSKSNLTISSTTTPGANGVKFKFSVSGATSLGHPVNGARFVLGLQLSTNGGPCNTYASPQFEMTNGKAKATFDGSSLTPPFPESGGSFSLCEGGASMADTIDGSTPARAGVRLGVDPD